jgi:hypothetical protein
MVALLVALKFGAGFISRSGSFASWLGFARLKDSGVDRVQG